MTEQWNFTVEAHRNYTNLWIMGDESHEVIAYMTVLPGSGQIEKHAADFRKMAAAPALLDACKSALNLLEIMEYSDGADEGELAIMKNIRAAIAQAEAADGN